jgi:hypothetical protein
MQTTLSCGVHCARDLVVQPSASHCEAEKEFGRQIQDICTRGTERVLCHEIQALHDSVMHGAVRRSAAAVAASSLQPTSHHCWSTTLLHVLLLELYHENDCQCLAQVLSWGTCPTVMTGPPLSRRPVWSSTNYDGHPFPTAFGALFKWKGPLALHRRQQVLSHGGVPWPVYRMHGGWDRAGCCTMTLGMDDGIPEASPLHLETLQLQAQWLRWHARRTRCQWIKLQCKLM